ncbi:MAG: SDR family NAD(P)-dependent oxidoreductase, partial [bacterium]|nr:SDR family NAD(P)-dependent oxidoreductase [bacterium]
MKLENKKALITGGSRGIGKVIAEYFLKEGAKVLIAARKKDELNKAKSDLSKISPSVEILVVDV